MASNIHEVTCYLLLNKKQNIFKILTQQQFFLVCILDYIRRSWKKQINSRGNLKKNSFTIQ